MGILGIMQGRLLPPEGGLFQCFPRQAWAREFPLAAQAELDSIEWIYDVWGEQDNPISSDEGIQQIKALTQQHGIAVVSVCADYFMERPLIRGNPSERGAHLERLLWLISRCRDLGIRRIVLPFVDASGLRGEKDLQELIAVLRDVLPQAGQSGIEIHLETSLEPQAFSGLLDKLPFANAKANYDIGNSASLGYDFREELAAYGERIGSVHIKDRIHGGGTVPLGQGNADVPGVLEGLLRLGFSGDFILQVARGTPGDELVWARHNRQLVLAYINQASTTSHGCAQ